MSKSHPTSSAPTVDDVVDKAMGKDASGKSMTSGGGSQPSAGKLRRPNGIAEDGTRWIWPFQLLERVGEGGMGVVYRARYVVNDREVAVKMLPDDMHDPVILARFEQELEILKDLKHPNIVRCFGGVCENEHRFYAMELVEGGSLEDDLRERGKLPWEQVVEYGEQMAAALQASHEKGIVHRDIKPGNFLKTKSGQLKLSDFGLARIDAGRKITRAGKTAGTVLYMAPEQIRGQEISPAADLYALGCVLYEMLTGRTPFTGDSAAALLHAHVTKVPDRLGQYATDCPPPLEELVHHLMQKAIEDRPASAAEVGVRLSMLSDTMHRIGSAHGRTAGSISSRPTVVPDSRTKTLSRNVVKTVDLKGKTRLPRWAIASAAVATLVLLGGLIWQANVAASLKPWKARWIELALQPGPLQTDAFQNAAELGPSDPDVIAAVIAGLQSRDEATRRAAATAANSLESGDVELIGALRKLAKNDLDDEVRFQASQATKRLVGQ